MKIWIAVSSTLAALSLHASPARAGFDAHAPSCTFSATSFFGHEVATAPKQVGRLLITWEPGSGTVTNYEWHLPGTDGSYSRLSEVPGTRPTLTQDLALGTWVLSARLDSNLGGWVPGRRIAAVLAPRHADNPEWQFAGILTETGSIYIAATGTVSCPR